MHILAIDTCFGAISVAIGTRHEDGGICVLEAYEDRATGHAERLAPMIGEQLARAGLTARDLSRVAVTLGPGSFTGVRTGIAAARAFRLAVNVEVVGLTSLAVMAHRVFETSEQDARRPTLVAVDARRGRLYAQLFCSGALDPLSEPQELTAAEAALLASTHGARVAGSGGRAIVDAAPAGVSVELVCEALEPHAGDLAWLAFGLTPLGNVGPIYIRPPDAKPQSDKRLARTP